MTDNIKHEVFDGDPEFIKLQEGNAFDDYIRSIEAQQPVYRLEIESDPEAMAELLMPKGCAVTVLEDSDVLEPVAINPDMIIEQDSVGRRLMPLQVDFEDVYYNAKIQKAVKRLARNRTIKAVTVIGKIPKNWYTKQL